MPMVLALCVVATFSPTRSGPRSVSCTYSFESTLVGGAPAVDTIGPPWLMPLRLGCWRSTTVIASVSKPNYNVHGTERALPEANCKPSWIEKVPRLSSGMSSPAFACTCAHQQDLVAIGHLTMAREMAVWHVKTTVGKCLCSKLRQNRVRINDGNAKT